MRALMTERNINAKELTKIMGSLGGRTNSRLAYDLLGSTSNPRLDTLDLAARALGVSLMALLDDEPTTFQVVPIIGLVGAGGAWHNQAEHGHETIELSAPGGEAVGVEVRGDSMLNYYRDGDYLIGVKRFGNSLSQCVGLDCILETEDGEGYVKMVRQGAIKGRFTLRSHNIAHPDLENVKLAWAAPVQWVRRSAR